MRLSPFFTGALLAAVVLSLVHSFIALATQDNFTAQTSANLTRPCQYYSGISFQVATTTGSAAASSANTGAPGNFRVLCTSDTYFAQGSAPTATAAKGHFVANIPEWVVLRNTDKLSFLAVTASGVCDVTECR